MQRGLGPKKLNDRQQYDIGRYRVTNDLNPESQENVDSTLTYYFGLLRNLRSMNSSCSFTADLRNSSGLFNYIYRPYELILYTFVVPFIICIGFVGNASFIWTVVRVSSLHTSTFIALCILAFADLFMLFGIGGINIYNIVISPIRYVGSPVVYNVGNTIIWFSFFVSEGLVSLVTVERYFAICHPIKHHLIKGASRTIKLSLIIIASSLPLTGIMMTPTLLKTGFMSCFIWPLEKQFKDYPRQISMITPMFELPLLLNGVTNLIHCICYLVIFIFNCYMYWKILITLRKRKDSKKLQISANFERNIQQISKMVIINGMVYFLYSTILTIYFIMVTFDFGHEAFMRFVCIRDIVMLLNASSNPVIYFMTNSSYRRAFRASLIKCLGTIRWQFGKEVKTDNISNATELEDVGKRKKPTLQENLGTCA